MFLNIIKKCNTFFGFQYQYTDANNLIDVIIVGKQLVSYKITSRPVIMKGALPNSFSVCIEEQTIQWHNLRHSDDLSLA